MRIHPAHGRRPEQAILILDARDQIADSNEQASAWFGGASGDVHALISSEGFRAELARARAGHFAVTLQVERIGERGPFTVHLEPLTSTQMLVSCSLYRRDAMARVLDLVNSEAALNEVLGAVVAASQAMVGDIACAISVFDADGSARRVAGFEAPPSELTQLSTPLENLGHQLGPRVYWSWPLRDQSGAVKGVLEAFSPTPRVPTEEESSDLGCVAALASLAIAKSVQQTQVREVIEQFELVLGTTQHVVYQWDVGRNRFAWQARAGDAFGHWAATREVAWWRELVHPEDQPRFDQALQSALTGTESTWSQTYRFRRADGRWAWVRDDGHFQRDEAGRAVHLVGVMQDITEQRDLRSRLALSERLASVGTLAAGVAHEINNPLAWITSNVNFALEEFETLKRSPRDPAEFIDDMIDALEDARAGAERVGVIVRDLKTFSRAQDERVGAIDVRKVLESATTMAANVIRHRAKLVREHHEVPPVEGNEGRLSQVFLNLLLNAAQALPENDAARHEIRVVTGVEAAGRVFVEVRDTGTGISPEVLPRIFDPFFTTRPVGQGTGLGLSICHSIVTGMGGTIEVDTRQGVGSTFRVLLPAKTAVRPKPTALVTGVAAAARGEVMVIDDEPAIIASIERVLTAHHHVIGFTSARDALAAISVTHSRPDVILCDVMMPELSGPEFFMRLKAKHPEVAARVVFMTGGAFTPAAQEFLDSVQPTVIDKPFRPDDVRNAVSQRIEKLKRERAKS